MIIDGTQFRSAIQITLARIGQPILAFGILQAFLQSDPLGPDLFPVLWGVAHTIFVFFIGLIISVQNYAVQSDNYHRLAIFGSVARRIIGLAIMAACVYGSVIFWLTDELGWSLLVVAYIASSVLNAAHNTMQELEGRRGRSIWINWIWIGALILAIAGFDLLPLAPYKVIFWLIVFRIALIVFSIFQLLHGVDLTIIDTTFRKRMRHGTEFGLNMAVETSAFPILTYAAFIIGGSPATNAIYAFSVEANFLFIAMTGIFQQATLHLGASLKQLRAQMSGSAFLRTNILHVLASTLLISCLGVLILATIGESTNLAYWLMIYIAVCVMALQTLAISWARFLDLTRAITLISLPSTFLLFVGTTLSFLLIGFHPRLSISLGVLIDRTFVGVLLFRLIYFDLIMDTSSNSLPSS